METETKRFQVVHILRNGSTEEWSAADANNKILAQGEPGIEFLDGETKIKIGDGTSKWSELPYVGGTSSQIFEVTTESGQSHADAIEAITANTTLHSGDICIVKDPFGVDKYSYTAYVYNENYTYNSIDTSDIEPIETELIPVPDGSNIDQYFQITVPFETNDDFIEGAGHSYLANTIIKCDYIDEYDPDTGIQLYGLYIVSYCRPEWRAMDGNYNAENVYFNEDMLVTKEVGYITLTNGQGTIPSKNKNLKEVFEAIWVKEADPSKTDPTVSVSLTKTGTYEAGTTVSGITYSCTFNDGKYTYGPEPTGSTAGTWTIRTSTGTTLNTTSGNIADILIIDNETNTTNFYVSAKTTYTDGYVPVTNKGNPCTDTSKQIKAGTTKEASSGAIKGYRKPFWGYYNTANSLSDPTSITSAQIRAFGAVAGQFGTSTDGVPSSFTVPADTKQVYFAVKAGRKNSLSIKNETALNAPVACTKVAKGVSVSDARGGDNNPTPYDLWYVNFDQGTSGSAKLILTWS